MLENIDQRVILDPVAKQLLATDISAQFGSLALMYAKNVWQGKRALESLAPAYQEPVQAILDYVTENHYQTVLEP